MFGFSAQTLYPLWACRDPVRGYGQPPDEPADSDVTVTLPEEQIDAIIGRVRQRLGDAPQDRAEPAPASQWTEVGRLPGMVADTVSGDGRLVCRNVRAFVSGTVVERAIVEIDGARIMSISQNAPAGTSGARVIDGQGRFLMPGIIDAHAHLSMMEHTKRYPHQPKGAEPLRDGLRGHLVGSTLRRAVRMGVTTIRDVGAYADTVLDVRQAMRYGAFIGPRVLSCARIVSPTAPGGRFFPGMYREADGPDDIRRAVREQIRSGADFLKIMSTGARSVELENPHPSQCTPAEMQAFIDEAHRQGYRDAAHCEGLGGTELAVVAGADTIEHGFYLNQRPDLLDRMAASGAVLVAKSNCGRPETDPDGGTVYPVGPDAMETYVRDADAAGARIIGACCGSTPAHIAEIRRVVDGLRAA